MKAGRQTTLRSSVCVAGVGIHSGEAATLTLMPAAANTGILFVRPGRDGQSDREVRADVRSVTATELATVLGDAKGPLCSTAEHVLAALSGLGVDNVIVEIDGPEVPIMDGSSAPFVAAIDQAGLVSLDAPRRFIKVLKPVHVAQGQARGALLPHDCGFRVEVEIDFDHPLIGRQAWLADVTPDNFRRDIARARTFGFMRDVETLWAAGFARGASLDNTLVIDETAVRNPGGLRYADEFARHKVLDAIGDLALAGAPLIGCYQSVRGGHRLNHAVLSALMADRSAWRLVESPDVRPATRQPAARQPLRGLAAAGGLAVSPAYGPDVS